MKILILLLSVFVIMSSGCNSETADSQPGNGDTAADEAATREQPERQKPRNPVPVPTLTPPPEPAGPCAPYEKSCVLANNCGEKYVKCLRPKAGKPARTEKIVCTKEGQSKITLAVSEWNAEADKNNLLCDFTEDDDSKRELYLYRFATLTVEKPGCKKERDIRKDQLIKLGYACK